MARPTKRIGTKNDQFRHRVPAHLIEKLKGQTFSTVLPASFDLDGGSLLVSTKIGVEVKFSLRTDDPALMKLRHAVAAANLSAFFDAAERGPRDLTHRELQAFLGLAYRQLITEHQANPPQTLRVGLRNTWSEFEEWTEILREADRLLAFETASGHHRARDEMRRVFDLDAFLATQAVHLSERTYHNLIEALPDTLAKVMGTLTAMAEGDYSEDKNVQQYPQWTDALPDSETAPSPTSTVTSFDDMFTRWKAENTPAASTVSTWLGYVGRFKVFLKHDDPLRVTKADALRWKDALVAEGRKKVSTTYLATFNALYRFALRNSETTGITSNPFDGVKARQKAVAGTSRIPFTRSEVALILASARLEKLDYLRWVPWLQAQTGARVAEIAQLWGSMIINDERGHPCIRITPAPDGGSLKNAGSERTVPLHPDIIAAGFLDFAKAKGTGPLFYGRRGGRKSAKSRTDGAAKHPSKGVSNRLGTWVRGLGITEERTAPTHAFRHWFKTEVQKRGADSRLADAIQGHAPSSEGDRYSHADTETMLEAISRLDLNAIADSHVADVESGLQ